MTNKVDTKKEPKLSNREKALIERLCPSPDGQHHIRRNRFTGAPCTLTHVEATVFDEACDAEYDYNYATSATARSKAVSRLDAARYLLLKLNPEAYMDLLD